MYILRAAEIFLMMALLSLQVVLPTNSLPTNSLHSMENALPSSAGLRANEFVVVVIVDRVERIQNDGELVPGMGTNWERIRVHFSITCAAERPCTVSPRDFDLIYDSDGRSWTAPALVGEAGEFLETSLAPGETIAGWLTFALPAGHRGEVELRYDPPPVLIRLPDTSR